LVYPPSETDKINVSIRICIRIRRILKVKIRIRRMGILTNFVTSLLQSEKYKTITLNV